MANMLLKDGADPNSTSKSGDTPVYLAAINGHDKVLSLLLEAGADKNIKNNDGANLSASCFAAEFG